MPPLRPGHTSATPEEAITRGIALEPDVRVSTDEEFAPAPPAIEVVPEIVEAYRAGELPLPPYARKEHPKVRGRFASTSTSTSTPWRGSVQTAPAGKLARTSPSARPCWGREERD